MNHSNLPMFIACIIGGLLSTMNVWANSVSDIRLSFNDLYMALIMTGWMFLLLGLYNMDKTQIIIGLITTVLTIIAIRTQLLITPNQYLLGMIPHHSMAVFMTNKLKEKYSTKDLGKILNSLTENIIKTQEDEINLMKSLSNY